MKKYFVYILLCSDNSYYIGITNNLERRLSEHEEGSNPFSYTFTRRPLKVIYNEEFTNVLKAIAREKQLKKWSRAKKEALIRGDIAALKAFSKGRNSPTQP